MIVNLRSNELNNEQKNSILDIYIDVFSAPPRLEHIDKKEIYKKLFIPTNYLTLLYLDDKIVSFAISSNICDFSDVDIYDFKANSIYFSEFATARKYQGDGYGQKMLDAHIDYLKNFTDTIYMRSRTDITRLVNFYLKNGFDIVCEYESIFNQELSSRYIYKKIIY